MIHEHPLRVSRGLAGQVVPGEYVGQWVGRRGGAAAAAGQLPQPPQPARRLSDGEYVRFLEVRLCGAACRLGLLLCDRHCARGCSEVRSQ